MTTGILTALLLIPLAGAFLMLAMPRRAGTAIKRAALLVMLVEFVVSLRLLGADYSTAGYRFVEQFTWIEPLGISYKLGIDGLSLWLVLLTTALTPIALYASWGGVTTRIKEYAFSFLLLELGMLGAFIALDLFLFYVFWELMLVPMYLIIGVWGGKDRVYAALKFFIYTFVGSLLMLVAILYIVTTYKELAGVYTFDLEKLTTLMLPAVPQYLLFAAFAVAFAIKVPMFPFHTWLPDAHVQAPTGGSIVLAAVLLKLGIYGFIRFAMPLFPVASQLLGPVLAGLGVFGIVYGAYAAWVQRDLKKLVAYSSVSHMGFILLGLFAMNRHGVSGAILQMINHGVSTGALFLLVGVIYDRRHSRMLDDFGGLAKVMPWYATIFVIVTMSSIGLPGTNGFVGEFMILAGSFFSRGPVGFGSAWFIMTLFAATGVIFAAVYMLHAVLRMFWGKVIHEENQGLSDLNLRETLALIPLIALIFWIGLYPKFFLDKMNPSVDAFISDFSVRYQTSKGVSKARLADLHAIDPDAHTVVAVQRPSTGGDR
ncbi:MAG: NADH-quinone oxidoreductase subunit M [Polyangiales bacterium]